MKDTRTNRKEREETIVKCLKKVAKIEGVRSYHYRIETWTKDDPEPILKVRDGIQITMFW